MQHKGASLLLSHANQNENRQKIMTSHLLLRTSLQNIQYSGVKVRVTQINPLCALFCEQLQCYSEYKNTDVQQHTLTCLLLYLLVSPDHAYNTM